MTGDLTVPVTPTPAEALDRLREFVAYLDQHKTSAYAVVHLSRGAPVTLPLNVLRALAGCPVAAVPDREAAVHTANATAAALVANLEVLDAQFPGHVRFLIGPERCDRLLAALTAPDTTDTEAGEG